MKNQDVPGAIGHVGSVLGRNGVNIANFSLGRAEGASHAVAVIETDDTVPEPVLAQLHDNPAGEAGADRRVRPIKQALPDQHSDPVSRAGRC
jgi:hypothetical protein